MHTFSISESLDRRHMTFFRHLIAWHFCETCPMQFVSDTATSTFLIYIPRFSSVCGRFFVCLLSGLATHSSRPAKLPTAKAGFRQFPLLLNFLLSSSSTNGCKTGYPRSSIFISVRTSSFLILPRHLLKNHMAHGILFLLTGGNNSRNNKNHRSYHKNLF